MIDFDSEMVYHDIMEKDRCQYRWYKEEAEKTKDPVHMYMLDTSCFLCII